MPETKPDSRERKPLGEYFEQVWGQALVAVSKAEEEASRAAQRVAEAAGWGQEELKRQGRELSERLIRQRRDLEHTLEEGVRRTLSRLRVPRREEIQDIQGRLDRVAARIDALGRR
jgi:hypothetical protein